MKSNFFKFLFWKLWISLLVFLVYMAIDFIFYGLQDPGAWFSTVVSKSIWSFVLAIIFTIIYHSASNWRPIDGPHLFTGSKLLNSIIYSLFISMMLVAAIALSEFLVTVIFLDILDAFRGIPSNPGDTGVLVGKVIIGGVVVEVCGKTDSDVPRG